jgi:hypothetical protein
MYEQTGPQDETGMPVGNALQEACEQIVRQLVDGVKHGFFEMTVEVEIVQSKKRRITIKAGKSYQFIVPEQGIP